MLIVILLEKFMASAFRVINEFAKKIYIYIFLGGGGVGIYVWGYHSPCFNVIS